MSKLHFSQKIIFTLAVLVLLAFGFYTYAWTDPNQSPPGGSVSSLIDSGATTQTKSGGLNVLGNVGIGTAEPKAKLEISGGDILTNGAITANGGSSINWNNAYSHTLDNSGNVHGAASINTPNAIIKRDENGNFSAGTISAALTGTASQNLLKSGDTISGTLIFAGVDNDITTGANENLSLLPNGSGNVGIGTATPRVKTHLWSGEVVTGAQEVLRLEGNWVSSPSGPLLRFTNQHNNGKNPSNGEYNVAGIAGLDDNGNWGGSLVFYSVPSGTSGGGNLAERMRILYNGNVGIGTTSPATKLDINGAININGAIKANNHLTHLPWKNFADPANGYIKLSTPIVHNEGNMFSLRIFGYEYTAGYDPIDIQCVGYAYSASTLLHTKCQTEGTDLAVEMGTETRTDQGGKTVVVIRIGTPTWNWYYPQLTAEYSGWNAKNEADFKWVTGETTPVQTGNTNNVVINDQIGNSWFNANGNVGIGTTNPKQKLEVAGGVRLNTSAVKPACDTNSRGTMWFTQGGAGVKDAVEICAKNAAGAYAWRVVW